MAPATGSPGEAPPFTAELEYAVSLLPEGLLTFFYRDARECAPQRYRRGLSPTGRRRRGWFLTSSNCARSASLAEDRRPDRLVGKFANKALPCECSTRTFRTRSEALAEPVERPPYTLQPPRSRNA